MEPSQLLGPAASIEAGGEVQPPPTERGCVLLSTCSVGQDGFERCLELLLGTSWDGDLDEVMAARDVLSALIRVPVPPVMTGKARAEGSGRGGG